MSNSTAARKPPITMIDTEADRLADMAMGIEDRLPQVSQLLLDEIGRAKVCRQNQIPSDVVTMHATVQFVDEASGKEHSYQLVYPKDADISAGRVSILTPVGAGLIGLREGQSILWPGRDGQKRKLTILKVTQAETAD